MATDSIAKASSFPLTSSNSKDFAKKKRANRSAKLKQCKLDARREQWLSQVKNKGSKEEGNGEGEMRRQSMHVGKERGRSIPKLEIEPMVKEENEGSINNYSDSEWPSNSPASHTSSILGSNDSGMNFTGSSSSSSSSSGGCCSGAVSEEEDEGDDGCLDDWEAMADALAATDDKHDELINGSDLPQESNENVPVLDSRSEANTRPHSVFGVLKSKQESGLTPQGSSAATFQAWRPDDAFRPQSLPNLSKQFSFPVNSDRHFGPAWGCSVASVPTSCPVCYEDLDLTDTSFLPCSCGFRLCLFCHKRILEEDGRCPGCRKQYHYTPVEGEATLDGGSLTFRLARSCSMVTRS